MTNTTPTRPIEQIEPVDHPAAGGYRMYHDASAAAHDATGPTDPDSETSADHAAGVRRALPALLMLVCGGCLSGAGVVVGTEKCSAVRASGSFPDPHHGLEKPHIALKAYGRRFFRTKEAGSVPQGEQ